MKRSRGSYGHRVKQIAFDHYRLYWAVDRKYAGSRLRFPTAYTRDTGTDGARRFAQKWGLMLDDPIRREIREEAKS